MTSIPAIIPVNKVTNDQLEELNTLYNGNLNSMSKSERSIWKSSLTAAGYTWNDFDGWGYWSIPSGLAQRLRQAVATALPATTEAVVAPRRPVMDQRAQFKRAQFKRPPIVSMLAQSDLFNLAPSQTARMPNPRRGMMFA